MVVASDGVWDYMNEDDVAAVVMQVRSIGMHDSYRLSIRCRRLVGLTWRP